jgi:hypothetical protein
MKPSASKPARVLLVAKMPLHSGTCKADAGNTSGPRHLPTTCSRLPPLGSIGAQGASSAARRLAQRRGPTCRYGPIAADNWRTSSNQQ